MNNTTLLSLYDSISAQDDRALAWIIDNAQNFLTLLKRSELCPYHFFAYLPMQPDPCWFITFAVRVGGYQGTALARHLEAFIQNGRPAIFQWWSREYYSKLPPGHLRAGVDRLLRDDLRTRGWIVDTLQEELYRKQWLEMLVRKRGVKYLKPLRQDYYPGTKEPFLANDLVIFHPQNARELPSKAPGIRLASFILARRAQEDEVDEEME